MRLFAFIGLLFILQFPVQAQTNQDSLARVYLEKAKKLITDSNFTEANKTLVSMFSLKAIFPDESAFFYGITQYYLGNYKTSKSAFKKYLSFQAPESPYRIQAEDMLQKAECRETGYYEIMDKCQYCEGFGYDYKACEVCKGKGKYYCAVCSGNGVVRQSGVFGDTYGACVKCDGTGFGDCPRCHGEKEIKKTCFNCNGKGNAKVKQKCP